MSERVRIGRVGKPHGLDGSFVVEGASSDPRWFKPGARLRAGDSTVEVVAARRASGRPVIRVDRELPRGTPLEVERSELPPTDEDEYYVFELIGLEVIEEGSGRNLGRVKAVEPGIANDVLALEGGAALPLVDACVLSVDLAARRILVAPGFSDESA